MIIKKNYPFLLTTPSMDIILHPLFHYPLYATLTFDSIPPYHPHSTHPPCLYLSLSLLINQVHPLSPFPPLSNKTDTPSPPNSIYPSSLFFLLIFPCLFRPSYFSSAQKLPTECFNKLKILWHARDTLGMDGNKIAVLEKCRCISL